MIRKSIFVREEERKEKERKEKREAVHHVERRRFGLKNQATTFGVTGSSNELGLVFGMRWATLETRDAIRKR